MISVEVRIVLPGDANGDGQVSALDITMTELIILGLAETTPGADANEDGAVNALGHHHDRAHHSGLGLMCRAYQCSRSWQAILP